MAWNRNEPDPLDERRRQLAELEKNLAEQRRRLIDQLQTPDGDAKQTPRAEPLVWRNEDDPPSTHIVEPTAARKRDLARQTRRDRIVAVGLIILLLVVIVIGFWIARAQTTALPSGT